MDNIINEFADILDEMAMAFYNSISVDNKKVSYFDCLTRTLNLFFEEMPFSKINLFSEDLAKIKDNEKKIKAIKINQEDIRKALLLLEIKGYKHSNYSLDQITPDGVGAIFTFLLDLGQYGKNPNLLDVTIGTGNLSMVVSNYSKYEWYLQGIEQDLNICNYLLAKANFLQKQLDIHMQDTLELNYQNVDAIIGDLSNYEYNNEYYDSPMYQKGVRDFSYLAIERHLQSGNEDTLAYYLVDSDFFNFKGNKEFKEEFQKTAYFKVIIVLPLNFFQGKPKMIVVVAKRHAGVNASTNIFTMPNFEEKEKWQQTLINIKDYMGEN